MPAKCKLSRRHSRTRLNLKSEIIRLSTEKHQINCQSKDKSTSECTSRTNKIP